MQVHLNTLCGTVSLHLQQQQHLALKLQLQCPAPPQPPLALGLKVGLHARMLTPHQSLTTACATFHGLRRAMCGAWQENRVTEKTCL